MLTLHDWAIWSFKCYGTGSFKNNSIYFIGYEIKISSSWIPSIWRLNWKHNMSVIVDLVKMENFCKIAISGLKMIVKSDIFLSFFFYKFLHVGIKLFLLVI